MIDQSNATDKYVINDKYHCIIYYIISVKNKQVKCKLVKCFTTPYINKIFDFNFEAFSKDWRIMSNLEKIKYL